MIDEDDELSVGEIRHLRMKALFRHINDLTQSMNVGDINVRTEHHTGNYVPYSLQIVVGFFIIPHANVCTKGL